MSMPELKPCPFCGSKAYLFVENGIRVLCPKCGASSKILCDLRTTNGIAGNATQSVIDAWNRRVSDENNDV